MLVIIHNYACAWLKFTISSNRNLYTCVHRGNCSELFPNKKDHIVHKPVKVYLNKPLNEGRLIVTDSARWWEWRATEDGVVFSFTSAFHLSLISLIFTRFHLRREFKPYLLPLHHDVHCSNKKTTYIFIHYFFLFKGLSSF